MLYTYNIDFENPIKTECLISIIICGISENYKKNISENIFQTIGTSYELLYWDNQIENKSISSAYNTLKKNAKGCYVCFMHEDLFFNTFGWGKVIDEIFKNDSNVGLIGVAGSLYKSRIPSSWSCIHSDFLICNYIQHYKDKSKEANAIQYNISSDENEVVMVDGLFMCIDQSTNQRLQFDEDLIKGFHGYDFNLSLQTIQLKKKVMVTSRILIDHFSDGHINMDWYLTHYSLCQKWNHILPLSCIRLSFIDKISLDYSSFYSGIKSLSPLRRNLLKTIIFIFKYINFHFLWYYFYKRFYSPKYSISGKKI